MPDVAQRGSGKSLVVAIGNPLRGDDGVAHVLAQHLEGWANGAGSGAIGALLAIRYEHQLCPELAAGFSQYDAAYFLDADPSATEPSWERVEPAPAQGAISHFLSPATLAHLARTLYEWRGEAWLLHLPAADFSSAAALSPVAMAALDESLGLLQRAVVSRRSGDPEDPEDPGDPGDPGTRPRSADPETDTLTPELLVRGMAAVCGDHWKFTGGRDARGGGTVCGRKIAKAESGLGFLVSEWIDW